MSVEFDNEAWNKMSREERIKSLSAFRFVFGPIQHYLPPMIAVSVTAGASSKTEENDTRKDAQTRLNELLNNPEEALARLKNELNLPIEQMSVLTRQISCCAKISDILTQYRMGPAEGVGVLGIIMQGGLAALTESAENGIKKLGISWDDIPDWEDISKKKS